MGTTTANLGRAVDFVRPDFHQVNLTIEEYLKQDRKMKLDSGTYMSCTRKIAVTNNSHR